MKTIRKKVKRVSPEFLKKVIESRTPCGRFLAREGRRWVAVDNTTYDAWTEEFTRKRQAIRWLRGEFEVGNQIEQWRRITDADGLIAAAMKQGVTLTAAEADMILGYFDGHDYCLMVNGSGQTRRHDEQYGNNHRGDEPCTIQDAIVFCLERNDELLQEEHSDEEYLAQLKKDEQALVELLERLAEQRNLPTMKKYAVREELLCL